MLGKKNNYMLLVPFMKRLTKRDSINIHMPRLEEENQFYLDTYINRFTILRVLLGDKNCYIDCLELEEKPCWATGLSISSF